jgi:hypothetical protein
MSTTLPTPRLVRAASFVNSAQADLARMRLAMDDIPAFLGNAAFVTWFWHYSNATGGARVYVADCDVDRAIAILRPSRETVPDAQPPWECGKCREHVNAQWKTCWRCGASIDGEEDPNFFDEPFVAPLRISARTLAIIIGMAGPLVLLLSHGSMPLLLECCAAVALMLALLGLWPAGADHAEPAAKPPDLAAIDSATGIAEEVAADGYAVIEERVLRAWQAAVLGLSFPPLVLYAMWLLLRISLAQEPLKPRELRRYIGAWLFSTFPLVIFLWLPQFAR